MLLMVAAMYFSSLCAGIMTDNGGQKAANFRDGRKNMAIIAMFTATSSEKINVRKISIIVSPDRYFHVKEFHVSSLAYYGPVHWPASQRLCYSVAHAKRDNYAYGKRGEENHENVPEPFFFV